MISPHKKKFIAPIIITVIMILYYIAYFCLMLYIPGILKYILGIFPVIFSVVTIAVCIERINEIKKGEEDDLSKY
ncbi:MAG: hypothetical protein IKT70_06235 [Clostridia bacterium]|nr:hypothetical protein [Clostridia bacterium]